MKVNFALAQHEVHLIGTLCYDYVQCNIIVLQNKLTEDTKSFYNSKQKNSLLQFLTDVTQLCMKKHCILYAPQSLAHFDIASEPHH